VVAVVVALGLLGPYFIASAVFPDRRTAVEGLDTKGRCIYDAAEVQPENRLAPPPTPSPVITGQTTVWNLPVKNTGSCDWDAGVALYRESGSLTDTLPLMSATLTVGQGGIFAAQIPFTTPMAIGVFDSNWRMRTPEGQGFGPSFSFSVVTYHEGEAPRYPARPLFMPVQLVTLVVVVLSGWFGLAQALQRSGWFIKEFYSLKNNRLAEDHLIRLLFNHGKPVGVKVVNGLPEIAPDNEAVDKIGGPAGLLVTDGMAALVERGGGFSRIVGPSPNALGPFERVRAVFDLRNLSRTKTEMAHTKDGIEVKVEATVSFMLMEQMKDEQIPQPQAREPARHLLLAWLGFRVKANKPPGKLPASPEAMRLIAYEMPAGVNWDSTVSSGIGDVIPQKMLDELWAPEPEFVERNPRRTIVKDLFEKGRENLHKRGIELVDINLGPLMVPDSVVARRREWWQAFWKKDERITEAKGEAEALQLREMARAEAQTRMINILAQGIQDLDSFSVARLSEVITLRFIDAIEGIASVWLDDESRPYYLRMLTDLRRLPGPPVASHEDAHG
jgi:regulator of protease activity HflC (stomatin/prohibitin superfamily)